jgi:hypothetical protein
LAIDSPPRVDHAAFDALDVGLVLRNHAADSDLDVLRAVDMLRVDLNPVPR